MFKMKSGTDEIHKLTETVYKNLGETFSSGIRQILLTGKAYYKALQVVTSAAQAYNEALGQFGAEARLCQGGTEEIGEAIQQIAEAQRAIQARLQDSAKVLFSELILPLEHKMEKDFKKASSDARKYSQDHKLVISPFNKACDTLKKFRKKTKNKPVYDNEKEATHMRSLGKCQEKLDEYRIQGLRLALLEERRCHCFVLQRLCSVAHLDHAVHRQGVDVYVSLQGWEDVCSNPHMLPPSADRVIADYMDDYQPMNGGTDYRGNGFLHRDTQSLHNGLKRSKSTQELYRNSGHYDGTQTLPHYTSPPPAPSQGCVQATYAFTAGQENQMSFSEGDVIVLMGEKSEGWQYGHNMNTHRMGWFPLSFTKPLTSGRSTPDFKSLSPANRTRSVGDMLDGHPPLPPPDHLQYEQDLPSHVQRPNSLYEGPPQTNSSPQRQPSTRVTVANTPEMSSPVRQRSSMPPPPPPPLQDQGKVEENVNYRSNPMFASVSLRKAQTNDRSAPKF